MFPQGFGVPEASTRAFMHAESFGAVHAISPEGAMGLMQIMPGDMGRIAPALSSRRRSLQRARQHHR